MGQDTTTLTFTQTVNASPADVYAAFTNANNLRQWLAANSQVSAREGGRLYLYWQEGYYTSGEFTQLEPEKTVAFTWQGRAEPAMTNVTVSLTPENGDTRIDLAHKGVGTDAAWESTRKGLQEGWESGLTNLKSILETGLDRRIYDRPFLGILLAGAVTPEEAEELGLPIAGGIRISGTLAGTGAEAAGVQNEDILVNLGGTETPDFRGLQEAIRPFKAGETVKVTIYRAGEKHGLLMKLSERPAPEVPDTPAAFAEELRALYDELDQELDNILAEVTEAEASHHPAEGEWNVKEILAHLIGTERSVQIGIAANITNNVVDGFPANPPAWVQSITAVYPTLPDIVALWKQTEAETVALVAAFPPEFVAQKVHYRNAGQTLLSQIGLATHTRGHFTQIREAIATARET